MTHHDHHHDHGHDHHHDHDHPHDHDHHHSHPHDHDHEHSHDHDHAHAAASTLSLEEKFIKLLEHWVKHNDDHARTYKAWADKAQHAGMSGVAQLLQEAAEMTDAISVKFDQAAGLIKPSA